MPALTITAVDSATGTLTIPDHGLNTGDGPGAMFVPTGGTLPGSLAPVTDYFAIKIDGDHILLADSNAHATAGTALSFTTNGSGALRFLIGAPYRRPRTYGERSQLKSADLNASFDAWTALWNLLTGQSQGVFNNVTLAGALTVAGQIAANAGFASSVKAPDFLFTNTQTLYFGAADAGTPGSNAPSLSVDHNNGAAAWIFTAPTQRLAGPLSRLRAGDRIISFGVRANTTPGLSLTAKLWFTDPSLASGSGNPTQVGSTLTHSNTAGDVASALGAPRTIAPGESFHFTVGGTSSVTPVFLFDYFVTIDRPV